MPNFVSFSYRGLSFQMSSGAFLCSVPIGSTLGTSGDRNGVMLAYGQSKEASILDDSAAVVFQGRTKPVAEFGQFIFSSLTLSYRIPPYWAGGYPYNTSGTYNGFCSDGNGAFNYTQPLALADQTVSNSANPGSNVVFSLLTMVRAQHGLQTGDSTGQGYLTCLVDIDHNAGVSSLSGPIYGTLYGVKFSRLAGGWIQFDATLTEVGT